MGMLHVPNQFNGYKMPPKCRDDSHLDFKLEVDMKTPKARDFHELQGKIVSQQFTVESNRNKNQPGPS